MKIDELKLEGFRGVPIELSLPFRARVGASLSSMVLLGDNGTGKSSIADAMEFALQARRGRVDASVDGTRSLAVNLLPCVTVKFSDGTEIQRSFIPDEKGRLQDRTPHPKFNLAPVVLRRSDILLFWRTKVLQRLTVFSDFGVTPLESPVAQSDPLASARLLELESERYDLKVERRESRERLAARLGLSEETVPIGSNNDLAVFARNHIYDGLTRKQRRNLKAQGVEQKYDLEAEMLYRELRRLTRDVQTLGGEIGQLKNYPSGRLSEARITELIAAANRISTTVDTAFQFASSSAAFIDRITVSVAKKTRVSFDVRLELKTGRSVAPQDVLSEANLDLLAFTLYIGFWTEAVRAGQAAVLVLDDVFQSIDANVRLKALSWLVNSMPKAQFLITTHERLWAEQIVDVFGKAGTTLVLHHLRRWSFEQGPEFSFAFSLHPTASLQSVIRTGDTAAVCGMAGRTLEHACNELSFELSCAITRRRGDKYTLGDLWPPVRKKLKKTELETMVKKVDDWLHLRNLVGAHYNEWANAVSDTEAMEFGQVVLELISHVWCADCARWVVAVLHEGRPTSWRCRCGNTSFG